MPGLDDLASLLGMEGPKKRTKTTGYDGAPIRIKARVVKRRGKTMTIVWGFESTPKELDELLTICKKQLGSGGQVTDNELEIQGDHVARVKEILQKEGFVFAK